VVPGPVFDDTCTKIGDVGADGIVRQNGSYVGCVNPDGTVLNEKGDIIGGVSKSGIAVSYNGNLLGKISENGLVFSPQGQAVGCVGTYGDVFDKKGAYLGRILENTYAYDLDGNFLNMVNSSARVPIKGQSSGRLLAHNVIIDENSKVIGVAAKPKTTIIDKQGKVIGHLFPDGHVYDGKGVSAGKMYGDGFSFYNHQLGRPVASGQVADFGGKIVGIAGYNGEVVTRFGEKLGRLDAKGFFFDNKGDLKGGIVKRGAAIGYDGSFLGYSLSDGRIIDL
jgi:hypothetical protein